jgi:hypothetical protein
MLNTALPLSIFGAALFLASSALAQDQPLPSNTPQVIIEGRKNLDKDIRDFVGALTARRGVRVLSRFEDGVCPASIGLMQVPRDQIVRRLRRVAEAADIPLASAKCRANVVVVLTPDKNAFLQALRKKFPNYFAGVAKSEVRRLLDTPGPAVAWQLPGVPLSDAGVASDPVNGAVVTSPFQATRLAPPVRLPFSAAVVVIENGAVNGLTTVQLADYAAMRAYADADPARLEGTAAPTILTMFDPARSERIPATLTRWDIGFLRGLYRGDQAVYAGYQRNTIRKEVEHLLTAVGEK